MESHVVAGLALLIPWRQKAPTAYKDERVSDQSSKDVHNYSGNGHITPTELKLISRGAEPSLDINRDPSVA